MAGHLRCMLVPDEAITLYVSGKRGRTLHFQTLEPSLDIGAFDGALSNPNFNAPRHEPTLVYWLVETHLQRVLEGPRWPSREESSRQ